MSSIGVGVIGFGRIGAEHAAWLSRCVGAKALAAADVTPARQRLAESRGLKVYDTLEALLADRSIDAVIVATPTAMHFDHTAAALNAGKHVMVEKPMALDLPQAKKFVELAEGRGRVLSVFHNRRWDLDYLTVKRAVETGVFGRVFNVESRIGQWASCVGPAAKEYHPSWRNEAVFGGGGLYDWGSHLIDQMWRLLWPAKPVRVFAQLHGNVWSRDCDDFARVLIDFDSGAVGLVEINTTTTRPLPRWLIDGERGSASSPHSLAYDLRIWAQLKFLPVGNSVTRRLRLAADGLMETQIWDRFAAAVRGEEGPAITARSVLPTMALLHAARESARSGTAVVIDSADWIF